MKLSNLLMQRLGKGLRDLELTEMNTVNLPSNGLIGEAREPVITSA